MANTDVCVAQIEMFLFLLLWFLGIWNWKKSDKEKEIWRRQENEITREKSQMNCTEGNIVGETIIVVVTFCHWLQCYQQQRFIMWNN